MSVEDRLDEVEKRLDRIEEFSKKLRDHPIKLKERFYIHDQAQRFLAQFEDLVRRVPVEVMSIKLRKETEKELKEVFKGMCILVDRALGVRYP